MRGWFRFISQEAKAVTTLVNKKTEVNAKAYDALRRKTWKKITALLGVR